MTHSAGHNAAVPPALGGSSCVQRPPPGMPVPSPNAAGRGDCPAIPEEEVEAAAPSGSTMPAWMRDRLRRHTKRVKVVWPKRELRRNDE